MKKFLLKLLILNLISTNCLSLYANPVVNTPATPAVDQQVKVVANENNSLQQRLATKIDAYKANHIFSAIYSIKQDNALLIEEAVGFADILTSRPLKTTDRMAIASGTKQMIAAIILKLQEKGKLDVNATISKYLTKDSYYFAGVLPEWADKITIHQLLTHTSGLPEYIMTVKLEIDKPHKDYNRAITQFAAKQPLNFNPGKEFQYSNTGYVMLGLIIEEITGKDLRSVMKEELFSPLNMTDTELATLDDAIAFQTGKRNDLPSRYMAIPTGTQPKFMPITNNVMLAPFADGGVVSSLKDLNIWSDALHNGKVLTADSYTLMTKPHVKTVSPQGFDASMGYGIYVVKAGKKTLYMHGGLAIGIRGEYIYVPADKLAINIISNVDVYEPQEVKGKIDYTLPANQIDIRYLMNEIINTILK